MPPPPIPPNGWRPFATQRSVCLHHHMSVSRVALTLGGKRCLARLSERSRVWRWLPAMIAPRLLTPHNRGRSGSRTKARVAASTCQPRLGLLWIKITASRYVFEGALLDTDKHHELWTYEYMCLFGEWGRQMPWLIWKRRKANAGGTSKKVSLSCPFITSRRSKIEKKHRCSASELAAKVTPALNQYKKSETGRLQGGYRSVMFWRHVVRDLQAGD